MTQRRTVTTRVPKPPNGLTPTEKKIWRQVCSVLSYVDEPDVFLVEAFVRSWSQYIAYDNTVREQITKGEQVDYKNNLYLSGAWKRVESCLGKLCLTPRDRHRVFGKCDAHREQPKSPLAKVLSLRGGA